MGRRNSHCLVPDIVTTLPSTIFDGFWSYLIQPLAMIGTWTLLTIGTLYLFFSIPCHLEILWIHWLTGVCDLPLLPLYILFWSNSVNTIVVNALAPCVAWSSAAMVHVYWLCRINESLFLRGSIQLLVLSQCRDMTESWNTFIFRVTTVLL